MEPAVTEGFKLPKLKGIEGITPEEPPKTIGLSADLDTEKFVEEEFYPGLSKNTIYSDLGPSELYTKNAVAQRVTKDKNIKFYFNPDNIGKSVDELAKEQTELEEQTRWMKQVEYVFGNGLDLDELDDDFFQKEVEELNELALAKPERGEKPPLERPSEIMLAIGGIFEIFAPPGQQFRALSVPFGYMLAKNAKEIQEADQLYNERLRDWGARLGLKREQVKMIADRQTQEFEVKQKHLAEMMKTRYGMVKDANELQLAYDKMKADAQLMLGKADQDSRNKIVEESFKLMASGKSPELRALGAALFSVHTGLEFDPKMSYTPEELKTLAEQAGVGLDNALKAATFGSKVATAESEAQQKAIEVAFLPEQLRAGLMQTFSVTNLNSVSAAVKTGELDLSWQKFAFEKAGGAGGTKSLTTILKGAFDGLDTTYNLIAKNQETAKSRMDARAQEVFKDVKLETENWFGPNKQNKEQAKAINEQRRQEALAKDEQYQQYKRQYDSFTSDLTEVANRRSLAQQMTPASIRASKVDELVKKLAKSKTEAVYREVLADAMDRGTITALEAVKATQLQRPPSGDAMQMQKAILNVFANKALKDPGTAAQYVDAILKEMGGFSGEVSLGSGPFPPPNVQWDD